MTGFDRERERLLEEEWWVERVGGNEGSNQGKGEMVREEEDDMDDMEAEKE